MGAVRGTLEDGRIGGQAFACRSLLRSTLASDFELVAIDSSISSISIHAGLFRAPSSAARLLRFIWQIVVNRPHAALIFVSHGLSFLEKGLMVLISRVFGVRVLLLPRSGHLVAQVKRFKSFAIFMRFVLKHTNVTLCQSASWQKFYFDLTAGGGCFRVMENWLPDHAFIPAYSPVSNSGGRHFVVGYFNRIEESKGIFDFLSAIQIAAKHVPNLRAVVYGDGSCVEQVRIRVRDMGLCEVIELRGWLRDEDKRTQLRKLDTYVFCSHVEGFPNSLLEILALKVPVVSVRVGAVSDVLNHDVSALLADIGAVRDIACHIQRLAVDDTLRSRLAEAAFLRVASQNTLEQAVRIIDGSLM